MMMILLGLEEKIEKLDNDIMANATNSGKLNELTKEKETAGSTSGRKNGSLGLSE